MKARPGPAPACTTCSTLVPTERARCPMTAKMAKPPRMLVPASNSVITTESLRARHARVLHVADEAAAAAADVTRARERHRHVEYIVQFAEELTDTRSAVREQIACVACRLVLLTIRALMDEWMIN